jgi:hypothetical protein
MNIRLLRLREKKHDTSNNHSPSLAEGVERFQRNFGQ